MADIRDDAGVERQFFKNPLLDVILLSRSVMHICPQVCHIRIKRASSVNRWMRDFIQRAITNEQQQFPCRIHEQEFLVEVSSSKAAKARNLDRRDFSLNRLAFTILGAVSIYCLQVAVQIENKLQFLEKMESPQSILRLVIAEIRGPAVMSNDAAIAGNDGADEVFFLSTRF